ncbi:MAG TPA: selenide, water dikinase SelD [Candidatus Limnocylindrales bacterium]|nr:selenide, water dikinase SelD [Candidatus Limnocylindrales bacterium]
MNYRLTKVVPVHGCSCKLPQYQLGRLLDNAGLSGGFSEDVLAGPWENSSVVKIADGIAVLNTLDFFTPMVDEAEIQGRIAGSNVTSDIYALAVTNIVSVLSIMAFPEDMPDELAVGMLKGFGDFCREMGAPVVGGHTIRNPWPIIGGAATGIGDPGKIVYTRGAKPGDQLFLTKPLGIAPAMAAYRLRKEEEGKELLKDVPDKLIEAAITEAIDVMTSSNKPVAEAMQKVPVHAATDVTGFGLTGHAGNMAVLGKVDIVIDQLAVIRGTPVLADLFGYPLLTGEAKETAGGMLIAVAKEDADDLLDELEKRKVRHFEAGYVKEGNGGVLVQKNVKVVEA